MSSRPAGSPELRSPGLSARCSPALGQDVGHAICRAEDQARRSPCPATVTSGAPPCGVQPSRLRRFRPRETAVTAPSSGTSSPASTAGTSPPHSVEARRQHPARLPSPRSARACRVLSASAGRIHEGPQRSIDRDIRKLAASTARHGRSNITLHPLGWHREPNGGQTRVQDPLRTRRSSSR